MAHEWLTFKTGWFQYIFQYIISNIYIYTLHIYVILYTSGVSAAHWQSKVKVYRGPFIKMKRLWFHWVGDTSKHISMLQTDRICRFFDTPMLSHAYYMTFPQGEGNADLLRCSKREAFGRSQAASFCLFFVAAHDHHTNNLLFSESSEKCWMAWWKRSCHMQLHGMKLNLFDTLCIDGHDCTLVIHTHALLGLPNMRHKNLHKKSFISQVWTSTSLYFWIIESLQSQWPSRMI